MDTARARTRIEKWFPNLKPGDYVITSPIDSDYNCISWAIGDSDKWWWPDADADGYWPEGVSRSETLSAFITAFESLGFELANNGDLESGYERLVVYADLTGTPTHVARQLPDGKWTSKIGVFEDITHATSHALEGAGNAYGAALQFMKRPIPLTTERI